MTGLLISLTLVVLLVLALQPAHNRSWRPGFDSRIDRDGARLEQELRWLEQLAELDGESAGRAQDRPQRDEPQQRGGSNGNPEDGAFDEVTGARPDRVQQPPRTAGQQPRDRERGQAA